MTFSRPRRIFDEMLQNSMILAEAKTFLEKLGQDLERNRIKLEPHWDIDHLCYRAATEERYQELKNMFLSFSELLVESPVNGRMISTFKLDVPIVYQDWLIELIELPAPKVGKETAEGFEHIEVVVDEPFAKLQEKYAHLKLDEGGLRKPFNQELEIVLGERNIKFHHISLESVIRFEAKGQIWSPNVGGQEHRLFLIEEKLLKYGGLPLRKKVRNYRKEGLKTEPAFGKALGLENDPYAELLRWQKLSIADLRATLKT